MPLSKLNGIKRLGLIAGNGKFPLMFARAAAQRAIEVVAIAIKGDTSVFITPLVSKVYWLSLKEYGRMFSIFKDEGVQKVIMAGQINPQNLFYSDIGDADLKALLAAVKDKRPDTVFGAVADKLAEQEIELIDSTLFLEDYLPKKGVLTKLKPDDRMRRDIDFGFMIAKKIAALDIGQTMVIKDGAIVAVEAIEGTDAAILRGGRVCNGGIVVIKVSKPAQDLRFDVPVAGPATIRCLGRVRGRCLAIEAEKTLLIDQAVCVKMADKAGIVIVAV